MAGVQTTETLASTKLMSVAPAGINDSRSRLLFEHHPWMKDGPACPIRLGLEEQLKPQEVLRTIVRSPRQSHSQRCSPTRELGSKVICVSSPNVSKVTSPELSLTAIQEGLRDSWRPWGRKSMNSCIFTSASTFLRNAASLSDLSLMHDHLAFSVRSPKHEFRRGTPTDPIGKDHYVVQTIPEFLLSPRQLPHAQMYQKRGKSMKQFSPPSFSLYPAPCDVNLSTLTSLFSSCYLSSSLNLLACPLYSKVVHSSQAFRRHGIPGGRSLQMSSRHFSRPLNSLMLPGQAPSSKRNTAFEHATCLSHQALLMWGFPVTISLGHLWWVTSSKVPGFLASGVLPLGFMHFHRYMGTFFGDFIFSPLLLGVVNIIQLPTNRCLFMKQFPSLRVGDHILEERWNI